LFNRLLNNRRLKMSSDRFSVGDTAWLAHTHVEHDGVTKASVVEVKLVVIEGNNVVCRWPSGGMWSETIDRVHPSEEQAREAVVARLQAAIDRIKAVASDMAAKAAACRVGEAVAS
jgi:hypothetical protein